MLTTNYESTSRKPFAFTRPESKTTLQESVSSMNILITGASGLIGSALVPALTKVGHRVLRLVRHTADRAKGEAQWNLDSGSIDRARLSGLDAAVHLAGENIAGRWSKAKKAAIRESRVKGTRLLAEALAIAISRPKTLVCASAIGFYGDRGDALLNEDAAAGSGFLADVCKEWENATKPAQDAGIRVVNLRIGIVLSPAGGALAKMLLPFKLGAGGIMGSGEQYWSWVAIDDVVGAIKHALVTESLRGPVNVVSPEPTTNHYFTKTMGKVLSRPTIFPMPAFAARLALGEMADSLLLASTRVKPQRLNESGYRFLFPTLEPALRHVLNK